ncbi:MAG: DegT/DnrJ/EryC1/StrS family aminotransferase [Verrucomicrobia subdivision 3 bacterium]|nr:DegT/DnrJ/EryC1/StrS family aminotransferase [Limisphaerales bacterium]
MQVPFLNLAAQYQALKDELLPAVEHVLAGGHYILGANVAAFEQEFASHVGVRFAVGVNSGSDALILALRALDIGPGDEVVTTPFTYIAPAEAIYAVGAKIVFADIHSLTFNIHPDQVARRVTARTKAIIPVHLFGLVADLGPILRLAAGRGIDVIEDGAQSLGAKVGGVKTGSFGRLGCFSFYPTKNLGAAGDGGMVVTNDESLARKLRILRAHGIERRYCHDLHGQNSRLDELQAAILRVKLKRLDAWNTRRRDIARRYSQNLSGLPLQLPAPIDDSHVFHVYAIASERRDDLQKFLADHGIPTIIYYPQPLHLQKVYADMGWRPGDFPVAEEISRKILPLPIYPEMTDEQIDYVTSTICQFHKEGRC